MQMLHQVQMSASQIELRKSILVCENLALYFWERRSILLGKHPALTSHIKGSAGWRTGL